MRLARQVETGGDAEPRSALRECGHSIALTVYLERRGWDVAGCQGECVDEHVQPVMRGHGPVVDDPEVSVVRDPAAGGEDRLVDAVQDDDALRERDSACRELIA